jgi:photosystem II stability/assembly factor-like uncharacterized protein
MKSTDAGVDWKSLSQGLGGSNLPFSRIEVAPANPAIVYAERAPHHFYRSSDAGATWREIAGTPDDLMDAYLGTFAVDPRNPSTVYLEYVGLDVTSLSKSTDGGDTWDQIVSCPPGLTALAVDPVESQVLLAGTAGYGIFRSTNGGITWNHESQAGIPDSYRIWSIAVDPADSRSAVMSALEGTYWSVDGGESFLRSSVVNAPTGDFAFAVDAIYERADSNVLVSTDSGATWIPLASPPNIAVRAIAVAPDSSVLYAGTSSYSWRGAQGVALGLIRSNDGGSTWSQSNSGIGTSRFLSSKLSQGADGVMYAGGWGTILRSTDGGGHWSSGEGFGETGYFFDIAPSPSSPAVVYATSYPKVFRSTDSGRSWTVVFNSGIEIDIERIAVDPESSETAIGVGPFGVWKTTDGGATWRSLAGSFPEGTPVWNVAYDPTNGSVVYLAMGNIARSTDGGESWNDITSLAIPAPVHTIAIDLENPLILYTGLNDFDGTCPSQHQLSSDTSIGIIFKSTDGGEIWSRTDTSRTSELEIGDIVVDPSNPRIVYADEFVACGRSGDLIQSVDSGETWFPAAPGLPYGLVFSPVVDRSTGRVYVTTVDGVFVSPPLSTAEPRPPRPPSPVRGR